MEGYTDLVLMTKKKELEAACQEHDQVHRGHLTWLLAAV
jgi:hypothetical protein